MNISGKVNLEQIQKEFEEFLKKTYGDADPEQDSIGTKSGEKAEKGEVPTFDLRPQELADYLKKYVECQDSAIEVLATKIATHYNRMKLDDMLSDDEKIVGNIKSNILMIGPTEVGKTYMIKLIAKKIGVPFVKGDATKYSETGYVGGDVDDLVRELVREADGDITKAEYGIIYLDEIDKIASSGNFRGIDVSRSGVQRNLLKLMEEGEVDLRVPHDMASQMEAALEVQKTGKVARRKVNTKNILFVVSGAFWKLEDLIAKRIQKRKVGFGTDISNTKGSLGERGELLQKVATEDLLEYGFESEFIGRLPVVTVLNDLSEEGLFNILKNDTNTVILSKKRDFLSYGIKVDFEEDALRVIASRALKQGTGARGLVNIVENIMMKFEKTLPSTKIRKFVVSREVVENPEVSLNKLLSYSSMKSFQERFLHDFGIVLEFTDQAISEITNMASTESTDFESVARKLFQNYEHGLKLAGISHFKVDAKVLEDPKNYLDKVISKDQP